MTSKNCIFSSLTWLFRSLGAKDTFESLAIYIYLPPPKLEIEDFYDDSKRVPRIKDIGFGSIDKQFYPVFTTSWVCLTPTTDIRHTASWEMRK